MPVTTSDNSEKEGFNIEIGENITKPQKYESYIINRICCDFDKVENVVKRGMRAYVYAISKWVEINDVEKRGLLYILWIKPTLPSKIDNINIPRGSKIWVSIN